MASGRRIAPGGSSSICFGSDEHSFPKKEPPRRPMESFDIIKASPGGNSIISFGSDKSTTQSTSASCHNTRDHVGCHATPRFNAPPGGTSTIRFGDHEPCPLSSNAYASGINQNSGNVLTERPTTRRQCPPGGATSICLGTHKETVNKTEKQKANDLLNAAQGEDKENVSSKKLIAIQMPPRKLDADYNEHRSKRSPPGGASSISLG
eukprot:GEMP01058259.1.p1 GENE.GEMP01058259.1~~GEMP01058259.1.p1  ORF type:complete len:214 (+),score=25.07 GEMP01058259.1:24-644(+)